MGGLHVCEDLIQKPKKIKKPKTEGQKPEDIKSCLSVLRSTRMLQTAIGSAVLAVLLFAAKVENDNSEFRGGDSQDVPGVAEMEGVTGDMEAMTEDEIADYTLDALAQVLDIDPEVLMEDGGVGEGDQSNAERGNNPDLSDFILSSL